MPRAESSACPGCKVVLPVFAGPTHAYLGASPACWDLYSRVLAREYGDPRYRAAHRLTVDSYAAQHPGEAELQSVNVHLVALHLQLNRNLAPSFVTRLLRLITGRMKGELTWLSPPASLGEVTVADVAQAADPQEHATQVTRWAHSVWQAWQPHHAVIIALAERALRLAENTSR